jgi:hypothetical protein
MKTRKEQLLEHIDQVIIWLKNSGDCKLMQIQKDKLVLALEKIIKKEALSEEEWQTFKINPTLPQPNNINNINIHTELLFTWLKENPNFNDDLGRLKVTLKRVQSIATYTEAEEALFRVTWTEEEKATAIQDYWDAKQQYLELAPRYEQVRDSLPEAKAAWETFANELLNNVQYQNFVKSVAGRNINFHALFASMSEVEAEKRLREKKSLMENAAIQLEKFRKGAFNELYAYDYESSFLKAKADYLEFKFEQLQFIYSAIAPQYEASLQKNIKLEKELSRYFNTASVAYNEIITRNLL